MSVSDLIALIGMLIGAGLTIHYRRRANDHAEDLKARDQADPIRKAFEAIRDDHDGSEYLVVFQSGRLIGVTEVYEVGDFASRVRYRIQFSDDEKLVDRNSRSRQYEEGMGAIRHDAVALITVSRSPLSGETRKQEK